MHFYRLLTMCKDFRNFMGYCYSFDYAALTRVWGPPNIVGTWDEVKTLRTIILIDLSVVFFCSFMFGHVSKCFQQLRDTLLYDHCGGTIWNCWVAFRCHQGDGSNRSWGREVVNCSNQVGLRRGTSVHSGWVCRTSARKRNLIHTENIDEHKTLSELRLARVYITMLPQVTLKYDWLVQQ